MSKKQAASQKAQINIDELKTVMEHVILTNRSLQMGGKNPIAIEVSGDSGIGKTSSIVQVAKEHGLNFVKLNLAQIEDVGDLVGFPIRQFEMAKESSENTWVDEHVVEEYNGLGWKSTGANRMGYCPPEWIANKTTGGILLLDDWNRADTRFIQAVMELVDRQEYISWKLPKDWHIVLTSNPDNGDYNVNSIDSAQRTRFINLDLKFDIKCWAKWAENERIDPRCINFLILNKEMVSKETNARSITNFFNAISTITEFESNLPLINLIGHGSVGETMSNTFALFINNKLDKLPQPSHLLEEMSKKEALSALETVIGRSNNYRADIASVITTRLINYSLVHAKENKVNDDFVQRVREIATESILNNDLKYILVRQLFSGAKQKFQKMFQDAEIMKMITK